MGDDVKTKLLGLKPKIIDSSKCTSKKSLHEQILLKSSERLQHQQTVFNLGNGLKFNDPIEAAEYILEREYGDSFLFTEKCKKPLFIPAEFQSNQYFKESPVSISDFKLEETFQSTLRNLKQHQPGKWLTEELDAFLQTQSTGLANGDDINKLLFEKWILNIKLMYLITEELKVDNLTFQKRATSETIDFIQECINQLRQPCPLKNLLSTSTLETTKREVKYLVKQNPPKDSNLLWLFGLKLSERGDPVERWLFNRILNDIKDFLPEVVILQSVTFLPKIAYNKNHQEYDFLIFSWPRKLIIGIEVKRQLLEHTAFNQLEKYHKIIEENLGDQLDQDWKFHPVICVEKDIHSLQSHHYISRETDLLSWITNVFKKYSVIPCQPPLLHPLDQLKKVLQIIVFTVHMSKKSSPGPIIPSNEVDYISGAINSISQPHNIVFYSNQQLPVLQENDPRYTHLLITGGFSSGKTFLLKEKAIQLSKDSQFQGKILYVLFKMKRVNEKKQNSLLSLLYHQTKEELEPYGIEVIEHFNIDHILQLMASKDIKGIFFDEWYGDNVHHKIRGLDFCWIATSISCERDVIFKSLRGEFEFLLLSTNFRNTKEIFEKSAQIAGQKLYTNAFGILQPPENFPVGSSVVFIESLEKAVELAKASSSKSKIESSKGILVIVDPLQSNTIYINGNIKFYYHKRNDFKPTESPFEFLKDGGVLVTSSNLVSGFDWPTIVYEMMRKPRAGTKKYLDIHECNVILRCTTKLFLCGDIDNNSIGDQSFLEFCKLLKISPDDNPLLIVLKSHCKYVCIDDKFRKFEKMNALIPILKKTLKELKVVNMETLTKTDVFTLHEDLLKYSVDDEHSCVAALRFHMIKDIFINGTGLTQPLHFYLEDNEIISFVARLREEVIPDNLVEGIRFLQDCVGVMVLSLQCSAQTKWFFEEVNVRWDATISALNHRESVEKDKILELLDEISSLLICINMNRFACLEIDQNTKLQCVSKVEMVLECIKSRI
ncbi:uncharacterized protein [Clytia hemisphaerica]|uniref:Uncharacterized protein n=1 Tax=Clytia hemisphaerica TaxID=252671 RepID=A0A7M5X5A4_9CNID